MENKTSKLWKPPDRKLPRFGDFGKETSKPWKNGDAKLPRLGNSGTEVSEDWERLPQEFLAPAFSGVSFMSPGNPATQQPRPLTTDRRPPTSDCWPSVVVADVLIGVTDARMTRATTCSFVVDACLVMGKEM